MEDRWWDFGVIDVGSSDGQTVVKNNQVATDIQVAAGEITIRLKTLIQVLVLVPFPHIEQVAISSDAPKSPSEIPSVL